jgi:hypothetical protein
MKIQRRRRIAALPFSCAIFCAAASAAGASRPTPVEARLLTPVSTYRTKAGAAVEAVVGSPLCNAGEQVLPAGTVIQGTVKRVSKVGLGLVHESASLQLDFTQLSVPGGKTYEVAARLTAIDNARERVDRKGKIHGIRATATLSNRIGQRMFFAAFGHPAAMIPVFLAESAFFHFPDPEIEFHRGTAMQLEVEFPDELGQMSACPIPKTELPQEHLAAAREVVNGLPYWTYSKRQPQPMDLVNLVFVGSGEEVGRAFAAAGWRGTRANSLRAGVGAVRAIAQESSFADAPMRTLLLDGREPEFRLQKSLDTFEKRDHLRIWKRDDLLEERQLWASAATRDTGTTFALHPFGITHEIQNEVDLERDQVVQDLVFSGCVDSVTYLKRPEGVRETGAAYRKGVVTDARVALIIFNGCTQPTQDFTAGGDGAPDPPRSIVRYIRRVTLTARNHFLRDNLVYRAADAARLAYLALRKLNRQARQEDRAARLEESRIASRTKATN